MTTANKPENQKPNEPRDLGQIAEGNCKPGTREHVEMVLETIKGANITATVKALNGIERGSYRVVISIDRDYNEVQIRLKDGPAGRQPIATAYIDRGHTTKDKFCAAEEIQGTVRAYLCR